MLGSVFVANGITGQAKKVTGFLTVLGGEAYALLWNLLAPMKGADKAYVDLVKVTKDHLKPCKAAHCHRKVQVLSLESARGRDFSPVLGRATQAHRSVRLQRPTRGSLE